MNKLLAMVAFLLPLLGCPANSSRKVQNAACPGIQDLDTSGKKACTEMGCNDQLSIRIPATLLTDKPSEKTPYTIDVVMDGISLQCKAELPVSDCKARVQCNDGSSLIHYSNCSMEAKDQGFELNPGTLPKSVKLTISSKGKVLLKKSSTPKYSAVQPNGPGCGPVCCQSNITLSREKTPQ